MWHFDLKGSLHIHFFHTSNMLSQLDCQADSTNECNLVKCARPTVWSFPKQGCSIFMHGGVGIEKYGGAQRLAQILVYWVRRTRPNCLTLGKHYYSPELLLILHNF